MMTKREWLKGQGNLFETCKRADGECFVTTRENAPKWIKDAVYEAHRGLLPRDWVYEECCNALDAYQKALDYDEDNADDREWVHEHADGSVDVYTSALFAWASEFCNSALYSEAEDQASDLLDRNGSTEDQIRWIQYCAIEALTHTIMDAATEAYEDRSDDDE